MEITYGRGVSECFTIPALGPYCSCPAADAKLTWTRRRSVCYKRLTTGEWPPLNDDHLLTNYSVGGRLPTNHNAPRCI